MRRRRVVFTRGLIPLTGGLSIIFLQPAQAKAEVGCSWRKHSLRVYFVPNEYYSSIAPHLLHIVDSYVYCFRSVLRRSFVCSDSGHGASVGVSVSFCGGKKINSWVHSWPVSISAIVRYDSVILGFIMCFVLSELDDVPDKLTQGTSVSRLSAAETTVTSGEETDTSQLRRTVRSKQLSEASFSKKKKAHEQNSDNFRM